MAAKVGLVDGLHAGLAHDVIGEIPLLAEAAELLGIDRSQVAQNLREQRPLWVVPPGLHRDLDARELEPLLGDDPGDILRHIDGNSHGIKARAWVRVDGLVDVYGLHVEEAAEPCHDSVPAAVLQVGRRDPHREGRDVRHDGSPRSIVDEAASGPHGLQHDAVEVRSLVVVRAVGDLEREQARGERRQDDHYDHDEDDETAAEVSVARAASRRDAHQLTIPRALPTGTMPSGPAGRTAGRSPC